MGKCCSVNIYNASICDHPREACSIQKVSYSSPVKIHQGCKPIYTFLKASPIEFSGTFVIGIMYTIAILHVYLEVNPIEP